LRVPAKNQSRELDAAGRTGHAAQVSERVGRCEGGDRTALPDGETSGLEREHGGLSLGYWRTCRACRTPQCRCRLDGLTATGQGIGAGCGPYRWRDCVDAKTGVTGAPLKMRRNREADKTLKIGGRSAPAAKFDHTLLVGKCLTPSPGCFAPSNVPEQTRDVGWRAAVAPALFVYWHFQMWLLRLQTGHSSHSVIVAMWSGGGCNVPRWDLDGP
jgi:hypothetical protein